MKNTPAFSVLCITALGACVACARPPVSVSLPPVVHADTETATNVAFAARMPSSGRFVLSLACAATPSNNVQVAFGTDANANGVLDLEETELLTGWDCGAWFVQNGFDEPRQETEAEPPDAAGSFAWEVRLSPSGVPVRTSFLGNGVPVLNDVSTARPNWLYSRS